MFEQLWTKEQDARENKGSVRAKQATPRAKRRAVGSQLYQALNEFFVFYLVHFRDFLQSAGKWLLLGNAAGFLAGTASWIFLISLAWATATRLANPVLLYGLPLRD